MKHETGICINCGASYGLHHFETRACPKNGIEETRFDELAGKFYPQQWQNTPFEDSGLRKLFDAAPELLEALIKAKKLIKDWHNMGTEDMGDGLWTIYEEKSPEMQPINNAIKKATQ